MATPRSMMIRVAHDHPELREHILPFIREAVDLPKSVERYVQEHKDKGMEESKAWAVAWSRYCKYRNPGSPRCKQDEYFHGEGKKNASYELSDDELRAAVIRLAHERPEFRDKLVPAIQATASEEPKTASEMSWEECLRVASEGTAQSICAGLYRGQKTASVGKAAQVLAAADDLAHVGAYLLRLSHINLAGVPREKIIQAAHKYALSRGEEESVARGVARIALDLWQQRKAGRVEVQTVTGEQRLLIDGHHVATLTRQGRLYRLRERGGVKGEWKEVGHNESGYNQLLSAFNGGSLTPGMISNLRAPL